MVRSVYDPVWEKLKKEKAVSLTANRLLHPRIIKAVTKRKWLDIGHKLEVEPKIATLSHTSKGSILEFKLTYSLTLEDF